MQVFGDNSLPHALLGLGHIEEVIDDLECYSNIAHAFSEDRYRLGIYLHGNSEHLH